VGITYFYLVLLARTCCSHTGTSAGATGGVTWHPTGSCLQLSGRGCGLWQDRTGATSSSGAGARAKGSKLVSSPLWEKVRQLWTPIW